MKAFMKKIKRDFRVLCIALLAVYGFVMYKYSFINTTYTNSDSMITLSQNQQTELSLDTCTNEENTDIEEVSEEASVQQVAKNYDLNTVLGREEYIWDFLIKCRFLTSSSSSYCREHASRKRWSSC